MSDHETRIVAAAAYLREHGRFTLPVLAEALGISYDEARDVARVMVERRMAVSGYRGYQAAKTVPRWH